MFSMLLPSVCVNVPASPTDLPQELDIDRHMVAFNVRKTLGHLANDVFLRSDAEKHIKDAVNKYLRRLQASGTITNFNVIEATCVSGTHQTFDEVTNLAPGAVPGDPYFEVDHTTGKQRYAGVVIYSDGLGNGLIFRGHDNLRGSGPDVVKVQVNIHVPHVLDYIVITVETGDPINCSP